MQINEALNLVIPIAGDDEGVRVYGYHTPISREVFEANFRILAATKTTLASKGTYFQMDAGPRIAALTLKDEGKKEAENMGWDGDGGATALLSEIKRLTTVMAPGPNGWSSIPVDAAIAQGILDADDWGEAESALVFFTCHYALGRKSEKSGITRAIASLLKGSSTSSSLMEFVGSLPKSTKGEDSAKAASSVAL